MLLLSAAALAFSTSTRASALLGDDAALVAHAQALATEQLEGERAHRNCAASPTPPRNVPRIVALTQSTGSPGVERTRLAATLALSPFAAHASAVLSLSGARPCE